MVHAVVTWLVLCAGEPGHSMERLSSSLGAISGMLSPDSPETGPTAEQRQPTTRPTTGPAVQARRFYLEGARLTRREQYAAAVVALRVSISLDPEGPYAARAGEQLALIEREGQSRLELAKELAASGRLLLAGAQFQNIGETFAGLGVAADARRELEALAKQPAFIRARREADAAALLEKARRLDQDDQPFLAYAAYQHLLESFADTEAGKAARKRLDEMEADQALMTRIRKEKAEREVSEWLAMADNYRRGAEQFTGAARTRFIARARDFYQRVIDTYPGSPGAATARAGLDQLKALESPTTRPAQ